MTTHEKALSPCPVCKSEIDLAPHEVQHVYEGDGGVIVRENGNVSTFGVQSREVMAAFHAATAPLPEDMAGLVKRLRNPADRYCTQSVREEAATLIQSQAVRIAELEAGGRFLVARLDEFDLTDDADEMCQAFVGHVEPAHERLRALLNEERKG